MPWLVERFADGRLTLRGEARVGQPHAPLEGIVVGAVEAWRRANLPDALPHDALSCLGGCHSYWFECDGGTHPHGRKAWARAAEHRVGFYEAVRQLLSALAALEASPVVLLEQLGALDEETARLLGFLLGDDGLAAVPDISPGALWVGILPPPERRSPAVQRLLRYRGTRVLTVPAMSPSEVAAYLARREVARNVWEQTGGLLEEIERLLEGAGSGRATLPPPAPTVRIVPPAPEPPAIDAPADALREADRLLARHALRGAMEVLEAARERWPEAIELLPPLADLKWMSGQRAEALTLARLPVAAQPEEAEHRLQLGHLLRRAGELQEAETHLREALRLAGQKSEVGLRAVAELAELALERTDYAEAARCAELVAEAAERESRTELSLEARNTLGKVRWAQHRLADAAGIFEQNRRRAEQAGLSRAHHLALNNLGLVAMGRDDLEGARALWSRTAELARRNGAVADRAVALENLGVVSRLQGRYGDAAEQYRSAARLTRLLGHRRMAARFANNLAELFVTLGHPSLAMPLFEQCDRDGIATLPPEIRAEVDAVRGEALVLMGEPERAEAALLAAYDTAVAIGHRRHTALAAYLLCDLFERRGEREEAREWLARAGELQEPRYLVRRALAHARLAATAEERMHQSRVALTRAAQGADRLLEAQALVAHAEALCAVGRKAEARSVVSTAEALEAKFLAAIPEALHDGFRERPLGRALAAVTERLMGPPMVVASDDEHDPLRRLIGSSGVMDQVRSWVTRVAPVDATVLITGESGTGKELVAESIHGLSSRVGGPFVRVNCGAIVDSLLASELFGHEKGAFTGAEQRRPGRFEQADGGTLFLDEVGELSPSTQSALLRVLQERTFERVGGTKTLEVDVRVVVATNRDLSAMVEAGTFRADLYYRLSGLHLHLPALRERGDDLRELADHLLARIQREHDLDERPRLTADGYARLAAHAWPGNIRELTNVLRSAVLLSGRSAIRAQDLDGFAPSTMPPPPNATTTVAPAASEAAPEDLEAMFFAAIQNHGSIYELRKHLEKATIARALDQAGGNIARAARLLGMKRPRVSQLVKAYQLKGERTEEDDA